MKKNRAINYYLQSKLIVMRRVMSYSLPEKHEQPIFFTLFQNGKMSNLGYITYRRNILLPL